MRKLYFLPFLFFCINGFLSGQTFQGIIYDAGTREPLPGVNIIYKVKGHLQGTISGADGGYRIVLSASAPELVFSYMGYEEYRLPVPDSVEGEVTKDIFMKPAANLLENVVVSASRFEQKLSNITVSMDVLKGPDVARQAPTDLTASLQTLPGVDVVDKQPSIRGGGGWTYSVGSRSQILVDGMSILRPGTGDVNWNVIPMENVEQVEIMKGASSVLYGSSALNGVINVRTARPGLTPKTHAGLYMGIYDTPANGEYRWSSKSFWKSGEYKVEPLMRKALKGMQNPLYEGLDFSHSRRIGLFDLTAGLNFFTDEGYRKQGYNKRFRAGGNLTYHQPDMGENILNYGFNFNFLKDSYGDFFIWRSPVEAYSPSPFTNMGREENVFNIDPFFNFTNPARNISHKVKARFYYRGDNMVRPASLPAISDILSHMGTDKESLQTMIDQAKGGDLSAFYPLWQPILQGDLNGVVEGAFGILGDVFPKATTSDYCDLISWVMNNGIPGVSEPTSQKDEGGRDKNFTYYLDYQFSKKFNGGAQLTAGGTFEHIRSDSRTTGIHKSDNAAAFLQYDQRFFDRLSVSAGVRAEYYRVDEHYRETDTKLFGTYIPVRPVFRAGINYQLAPYSFLRASFGQGYRNPSIVEKYARKDIGGVGVYPNLEIEAEKGMNAEIGVKQGYRIGNVQGFVDAAAFYTQYRNMVEFQFGLFNNTTFLPINSIPDAIAMFTSGGGLGIGAQFHNVSKARIYGVELSTTGTCQFDKETRLLFTAGYVFLQPEDVDYRERNTLEDAYTDPLQMKEKSNTSRYLKYRQKHTLKGMFDLQWKRFDVGVNMAWKSKTLAVDYLMVDERPKLYGKNELMDYVRDILFGNIDGRNLNAYWKEMNKDYFTMDLRMGVRITPQIQLRFLINNLLNKEYSVRPMAVSAPRTYVMQLNFDF